MTEVFDSWKLNFLKNIFCPSSVFFGLKIWEVFSLTVALSAVALRRFSFSLLKFGSVKLLYNRRFPMYGSKKKVVVLRRLASTWVSWLDETVFEVSLKGRKLFPSLGKSTQLCGRFWQFLFLSKEFCNWISSISRCGYLSQQRFSPKMFSSSFKEWLYL